MDPTVGATDRPFSVSRSQEHEKKKKKNSTMHLHWKLSCSIKCLFLFERILRFRAAFKLSKVSRLFPARLPRNVAYSMSSLESLRVGNLTAW